MIPSNTEQNTRLQQTGIFTFSAEAKHLLTISLQLAVIIVIIGSILSAAIVGALITPYVACIGLVAIIISLIWIAIAFINHKKSQQLLGSNIESKGRMIREQKLQAKPLYNSFSIPAEHLASVLNNEFFITKTLPSSLIVQGADKVVAFTSKKSSKIKLFSIQTSTGSNFNIVVDNCYVARLALIPPEIAQTQNLLPPYNNANLATLALSTTPCWEKAISMLATTVMCPNFRWVIGKSNPQDALSAPPVVMMWNPFEFYPDTSPYNLPTTHPLHKYSSFESLCTMFKNLFSSLMQAGIYHLAIPSIDLLSPNSYSQLLHEACVQNDIDLNPESRRLLALVTTLDVMALQKTNKGFSVYCYSPQHDPISFWSQNLNN